MIIFWPICRSDYSARLILSTWAVLNECFPKINFLTSALLRMTLLEECTTWDNGFFPWVESKTRLSCARLCVVALECLGELT